MAHDLFYDLKALQEAWDTHFNKDKDNQIKWHDIKMIKVEKHSPMTFFYKTSFADTVFKTCLVKKRRTRHSVESVSDMPISLTTACTEKFSLSDAKKKDIKELVDKNVVPKPYFDSFYKMVL
ncbi:DDE_Tnp_1_7 domain-containing protein [Trichonephila inaurata madagascariensis]|uniref:DDE_Tnp_1_7 domain-containing protein n=1 Tax=Trichonephila inaurata madagascariensis TaxID=2747483 RepID=A0A8X7CRD2_9ARAC|nr:DDE_Tnp_1_7 domain-containing protein [Trichonephila inaurata madagascariensis]